MDSFPKHDKNNPMENWKVWTIVGGVCALWFAVDHYLSNWRVKRKSHQIMERVKDRIAHPEKYKKTKSKSKSCVSVSEAGVSSKHLSGRTENVNWEELQKVEVRIFEIEPYYILHGEGRGCVIPFDAQNSDQLLDR